MCVNYRTSWQCALNIQQSKKLTYTYMVTHKNVQVYFK